MFSPFEPRELTPGQLLLRLVAAAALCVVVALGYAKIQPQIQAGNGFGWDGRVYAEMFNAVAAGKAIVAEFPFCKRVGVPALAAKSGLDGFLTINVLCGLVAALSVFFVACRRAGFLRAVAVMAPLLFYIFAPLRFSNFYPWTVDPLLMALMALAVLAFEFELVAVGIALLIVAIPVKETAAYFAVVAGVCFIACNSERTLSQRVWGTALVVIAAGAAASVYRLLGPGCDGSSLHTILSYARQFLSDPWRVLTVIAAVLLTLGPFLYRFELRNLYSAMRDRSTLFGVVALLVAVSMAALGGSDSTRLFYVCYPLYVAVVIHLSRLRSIPELIWLGIAGLIVNRSLAVIPEPSTYVPDLTRLDGYFSFFPDVAGPVVAVAIIAFFLCAYTALARLRLE